MSSVGGRPGARLRMRLHLGAVLGCLLGILGAEWLRHDHERSQADAIGLARVALEQKVQAAVAPLDRLIDEAGRRMSAAASAADPDEDDPLGAKEAQRIALALQEALRTVPLRQPAVMAAYDRHDAEDAALARATSERIEVGKEVGAHGRLATATVHALAAEGAETGWSLPASSWLWFEPEGTQGARIVRAAVVRSFEIGIDEGDKTPALYESAYLVTASMPFDVDPLAVAVRCEIVDGALRSSLDWQRVSAWPSSEDLRGRGWSEELLLDPASSGWRFPTSAPLARAEILVRHRWHALELLRYAPWVLGAYLLLQGLSWWLQRRLPSVPPTAPDVTAEAAHEMRTPLTVMRGALEVALRRDRSPKEYQETLDLCLEEVKGLQNLQDAVLFLGRGARAEPAREPVDLLALAEGEVSRLRGGHAERQIALDAVPEPLVMTGDPSLLARLLGNLLDNAALHSTPGGAIRIALARSGQDAVVTVEDDGPGVPPARRERIFERFYRGPEASRRGVPGSGLGLPIARWLAELHGGSLTLDPEPTDRARFRLSLPLM